MFEDKKRRGFGAVSRGITDIQSALRLRFRMAECSEGVAALAGVGRACLHKRKIHGVEKGRVGVHVAPDRCGNYSCTRNRREVSRDSRSAEKINRESDSFKRRPNTHSDSGRM